MRRPGVRTVLATLATVLAGVSAAGCAAPYDDDGELFVGGSLVAAPAKDTAPTPVVIDSDLAPDDLVAIAYLLRHPAIDVRAITVPATGLVTCPAGPDLLGDLFAAIDARPVPVACGRTTRPDAGVPMPTGWSMAALTSSGLDRSSGGHRPTVVRRSAATLIAGLADEVDGLHVVALAPLTELARVQADHSRSYGRLAGITAMGGILEGDSQDAELGVAEWNAAADPEALASVLAGEVPLTLVPYDPVPAGRPAGLAAPVVSRLGTDPAFAAPAYWDVATAGVFTNPEAGTFETADWQVDVSDDRGRLAPTAPGEVRVATRLDAGVLDSAYADVFGVDLR